ncbi:uncharacterized protein LOC142333965 isoform X1 [Lycorma delicatula]|uniref:uncharacterized protein LOC142333965 isoform X1 n=1 Tax=Lycorma delicatula TaxID=130591 RepID=UPI003F514954
MFHIKLVSIILLCVVYYNEATVLSAIDKAQWKLYFLNVKQHITDLLNRSHLYHTQISCYLCIDAEINKKLELINILSNDQREKVKKFKSDMTFFKERFEYWRNLCDKGMPTNTRKTFYEIYTTTHYKASLQPNKPLNVEECMSLFTRAELKYIEFDKIRQRYEDDYLSHMIFQKQVDANISNKNCMNCIKDFVNYELQSWNEIEPTVRYFIFSGKKITGELRDTIRDIFINYNRYIDAVQSWITTCSSTSTYDVTKNFKSGPKFQEINPLISNGKSERMEECIYHYINEKRYRNLLASTGKKVNSQNEVETKVTELIRQITY